MKSDAPSSTDAAKCVPVPAVSAGAAIETARQSDRFWPRRFWQLMEIRIGVLPLPIVVALVAILSAFSYLHKLPFGPGSHTPAELCTGIAVLAVGGFICGELGRRLPLVRHLGAAAIFATFIPSALAYYHLVPDQMQEGITRFVHDTNILYVFIAAIIVGSILGMDRTVLIRGFLKIFVPLGAGSLAAMVVGTMVGALLGLGAKYSFFYVAVPIMAGGVGEGAVPLSVGYAAILHTRAGDEFASVLPPVMFGSLTAILFSGALNFVGKRLPRLTGEGRLQPGEHDEIHAADMHLPHQIDVGSIAAAASLAVTLYLAGVLGFTLTERLPGPVVMLFLAVIVKLTMAVPPKLQQGAQVMYKFFATAVTFPILFAIGAAMTPWDKLVAAMHPANLVTIVATVATLMGTGWVVGKWVKLFPIEAAIVNACHSGQGGTGDVAILTAANRMQLMPFAQIATRIGGAITVTLTLFALMRLG